MLVTLTRCRNSIGFDNEFNLVAPFNGLFDSQFKLHFRAIPSTKRKGNLTWIPSKTTFLPLRQKVGRSAAYTARNNSHMTSTIILNHLSFFTKLQGPNLILCCILFLLLLTSPVSTCLQHFWHHRHHIRAQYIVSFLVPIIQPNRTSNVNHLQENLPKWRKILRMAGQKVPWRQLPGGLLLQVWPSIYFYSQDPATTKGWCHHVQNRRLPKYA